MAYGPQHPAPTPPSTASGRQRGAVPAPPGHRRWRPATVAGLYYARQRRPSSRPQREGISLGRLRCRLPKRIPLSRSQRTPADGKQPQGRVPDTAPRPLPRLRLPPTDPAQLTCRGRGQGRGGRGRKSGVIADVRVKSGRSGKLRAEVRPGACPPLWAQEAERQRGSERASGEDGPLPLTPEREAVLVISLLAAAAAAAGTITRRGRQPTAVSARGEAQAAAAAAPLGLR